VGDPCFSSFLQSTYSSQQAISEDLHLRRFKGQRGARKELTQRALVYCLSSR
jgi:hypothetical protein